MVESDPIDSEEFKRCVIRSTHEEACALKQQVIDELEHCCFSEESTFAVKLALEEALSNAVKHGNQNDDSKTITLSYSVTPQRVVIRVRDEGPGFLPEEIPDPTTPARLPLPNGRGVMLMRAYMDEVRYRDRGREVEFVKRRT